KRGKRALARGCSIRIRPGSASAGAASSTFRRSRSLAVVPLERDEVLAIRADLRGRLRFRLFETHPHVDQHLELRVAQRLDHVLIFVRERSLDLPASIPERRNTRFALFHVPSLCTPVRPMLTATRSKFTSPS